MVVLIRTSDLSPVGLQENQEEVRKHVPQSQNLFMWEPWKKCNRYKADPKYQQPVLIYCQINEK